MIIAQSRLVAEWLWRATLDLQAPAALWSLVADCYAYSEHPAAVSAATVAGGSGPARRPWHASEEGELDDDSGTALFGVGDSAPSGVALGPFELTTKEAALCHVVARVAIAAAVIIGTLAVGAATCVVLR